MENLSLLGSILIFTGKKLMVGIESIIQTKILDHATCEKGGLALEKVKLHKASRLYAHY